jgi:hypothetical protein
MALVAGSHIRSFNEAAQLAFKEARVSGMKTEVSALFVFTLNPENSMREVEKAVSSAVRERYGRETDWDIEKWWHVPVPLPCYESRGMPSLIAEVRVYIAASVEVTLLRSGRSHYVAVVEPMGKPQKTALPLCFLRALLDDDLARYRIVGKDGMWTSWEVVGLKQPLRLHDKFVSGLRDVFKLKPVADWLEDFGSQGQSLVPLVVGALLGLSHQSASASLPVERQPYSQEGLLEAATGLGYSIARAERALERAAPELRVGMTMAEAVRLILKYM